MFKKKLSLALNLWMAVPMAIAMAMALPLFTTGQVATDQVAIGNEPAVNELNRLIQQRQRSAA